MENKNGYALFIVICIIGVLTMLSFTLVKDTTGNIEDINLNYSSVRAFWLAEAGVEKAISDIEKEGFSYKGEEVFFETGSFKVIPVIKDNSNILIISEGKTYFRKKTIKKKIEVLVYLKKSSDGKYYVIEKQWKLF